MALIKNGLDYFFLSYGIVLFICYFLLILFFIFNTYFLIIGPATRAATGNPRAGHVQAKQHGAH